MLQPSIVRYLNPLRLKRERELERRLAALRHRDGDNCTRCRRPMRFDLPAGHDQGAAVELVVQGGGRALENLILCHPRCYAAGLDQTAEVSERVRRKNEAALFTKSRKRQRKAA